MIPRFSSVGIATGCLGLVLLATPGRSEEPVETPAPVDPYSIKTVAVPDIAVGQAAGIDFTPAGDCVLLTRTGQIFLKKQNQMEWKMWSGQGLQGATGLSADYFPKSLYVIHATGISRLFDNDNDARVDFVKAVIPTWRFGTLGELFRGSPALLPNGDLLLAPNVSSGDWSGIVMRVPEAEGVSPWLTGFEKVTTPAPGPEGGWIVAGFPSDAAEPEKEKTNGLPAAIWIIDQPDSSGPVEKEEAAPETDEGTEKQEEAAKKDEAANVEKDQTTPIHPQPVAAPIAAIHLPPALMPGPPITPACPIGASGDAFGPFSEQAFVAGASSKHLLRLMLERVGGFWQGAVTNFAALESAKPGLDFLRFTPMGDELLAGQAGQLLSIRPTGTPIYAVRTLRLASDGFEVSFTQPIDRAKAIDLNSWNVSRWEPGISDSQATPLSSETEPADVVIDSDGLAATYRIEELEPGGVYIFDLSKVLSESGAPLSHGPVYYTLNAVPTTSPGTTPLKQTGESSDLPNDQPTKATRLDSELESDR